MTQDNEITIEIGSTSVYADLGYADAGEIQRKSQLAGEIARAIKARHLSQSGAAGQLGIDQSKISHHKGPVSRCQRSQAAGVGDQAGA